MSASDDPTAPPEEVLSASGLRIQLRDGTPVIADVSLDVRPGEILGLVGESGSGKTTTALSLFGLYDSELTMADGAIVVSGQALGSDREFRRARGRLVSYAPQNPGAALNPALRVAGALEDIIRTHRSDADPGVLGRELLERVGLPDTPEFIRRYPHQLSGGQQQRVCIAGSLAPQPALIVLDEPTTGLDVVTQDRILQELLRLRDEENVAMLYITHDLAVVSQITNRIAVMYAGRIVEQGPTEELLRRPRHPYTRGLMAATPDHLHPRTLETMPGVSVGIGEWPAGCPFAPRCAQRTAHCESELPQLETISATHAVRCFEWRGTAPLTGTAPDALDVAREPAPQAGSVVLDVQNLSAEYRGRGERVVAAQNISFTVERGSCVALVGESGSGKTTIGRVIAGLHHTASGTLLLDGEPLAFNARKRSVDQRRRLQIIFQNPYQALNPRHTVAESVARPATVLRGIRGAEAQAEVRRLLEAVRLPARVAARYPRELSGGERQRVAIARALAANPEVIICDEITSALDVSVQAVVIELLRELLEQLGVALIFITHDLGVVSAIAEQTLVLERGDLCEQGPTAELLARPQNPYTQRLLHAAPSLSEAIRAWEVNDAPPAATAAAKVE